MVLTSGTLRYTAKCAAPRLPEIAVRLNVWLYGGLSGVRTTTTLLSSFVVMLVPCLLSDKLRRRRWGKLCSSWLS